MIRDPAFFQLLLDNIARMEREERSPREHRVAESDEIPVNSIAAIETEQALVEVNRELIDRFENPPRPRWRARGARTYRLPEQNHATLPPTTPSPRCSPYGVGTVSKAYHI